MNDINDKERLILSQFRLNARENLTTTSRKIRVPISTIYDKLKRYEGTIIKKHCSLLDFRKIGYAFKNIIIIKCAQADKTRVKTFLKNHPNVNTLSVISNEYDFIVEVILKDLEEVESFNLALEKFDIVDKHSFFTVRDVKREAFLTNESIYQVP